MKKGVKFLKYSDPQLSRQTKQSNGLGRPRGKRKRDSRQNKKPHGNKKKTQDKRKNLTAKRIPSREK